MGGPVILKKGAKGRSITASVQNICRPTLTNTLSATTGDTWGNQQFPVYFVAGFGEGVLTALLSKAWNASRV